MILVLFAFVAAAAVLSTVIPLGVATGMASGTTKPTRLRYAFAALSLTVAVDVATIVFFQTRGTFVSGSGNCPVQPSTSTYLWLSFALLGCTALTAGLAGSAGKTQWATVIGVAAASLTLLLAAAWIAFQVVGCDGT